MPFRRRTKFPGLTPEATQELVGLQDDIAAEARALRAEAIGVTTDTKQRGTYAARYNERVRCSPDAAGLNLTFPAADSKTQNRWIEVLKIGGGDVRVRGVSGTVQGGTLHTLTADGFYYYQSDGAGGWWIQPSGGGGGGESLAATLVIGNATGGTDLNISAGDELRFAGAPGVAGQVATSQGPGLEPVWAPAGGAPAWSSTLAVSPLSGANSPSINAAQRLDFAGGGVAGGDIRGALALSLVATTGPAIMTSSASLAAIAGQTAAQIQAAAGSVTVQAGGANSVINRTNGVTRFSIDGTGTWLLAGASGAAGEVMTSQGAGTPPLWVAPTGASLAAAKLIASMRG